MIVSEIHPYMYFQAVSLLQYQEEQVRFECVFCHIKLQIYPFLSLCVATYGIIAFKFTNISEGKKIPQTIHIVYSK